MVGSSETPQASAARPDGHHADALPRLAVDGLVVEDDTGRTAVDGVTLAVRPGEIVGIAGVSGNGQRELVEALVGQRRIAGGTVLVEGAPFRATRGAIRFYGAFSLTEEPLRTACVPTMSVAED